ncbi:hypothetical protein C900_00297 [Fulvivirga imtechensis AK7]|uniref:Uncharacterized protein n=1 Tax=Fulvivirga imtechensis AK7 TaxID=1237149 RepID=L8JI55_9BACT|nr:hypothetical protein [Fulvivirga imtechensis]ELR68556.1 hypothetical protein C900_00297 [Fulvivirga imtechensis AK7]
MKTQWESSRANYNLLLKSLDTLIEETNNILAHYQQANVDFAYQLYGDDLIPLLKKVECHEFYEAEFRRIHSQFQDHLQDLVVLRDKVHIMAIQDIVNYPLN